MSRDDLPHRRRNLLTGEWVLVSPHRAMRPWQGEQSPVAADNPPSYDPDCYLCPGNARTGGNTNPAYGQTFVFPNDFPALLSEGGDGGQEHPLFQISPARGEARVICYSPDHSRTLARMDDPARAAVIDCWCDLSRELGAKWAHVQLFENKGAMMGASSPHPHGQVWASDFVPQIVAQEDARQRAHASASEMCLLEEVIAAEISAGERVVEENDHWLAIVPHWAAWPFETLLVAKQDVNRLENLDTMARGELATILGRLLGRYDGLFGVDFPYSMGWHGAPHSIGDDTAHWRLHAHFHPPLLRSATIRKHMVGFELLAETQRDLTPEQAAQRLREVAI
ncbi:UDP-glucose--hexose-1-phosphate uridylyltransferase [Parerythrobacter lacustris]|uniref:Galactose-1-phosphate uridylyltransferase n=1 Tax=Parerythrobacter lacustris TaxID=2969984 RepID=A0ABT1XRQ9_9SPHN|nr:UDP-glucose--hexose-1-phosphate uridylyltransferase [Parerythrobacter lacustris]MCR2834348.1 UDP-glucose--hexose-1-phosphate uridylyltransferase [Parerythrobacter lacustris]